jgi:hypothetical protein
MSDSGDHVRVRGAGPRSKLVAAVVLVAAMVAVVVAVVTRSSGSHTPADKSTSANESLAQLTRRAPCPPPKTTRVATRAQLRVFHAVAAVDCLSTERTYPDGEWTVRQRRATRTGIATFVRRLDKPDTPRTIELCSAILILAPPVALVDEHGAYLIPRFPRGVCGQPEVSIARALTGWQVLSTRKETLQRTTAAITAQCAPRWKNEVYYYEKYIGVQGPNKGGPVLQYPRYKTLRVCIYKTPARDLTVGTFERGLTLNAHDSSEIRDALGGAGTNRVCRPQRRFAVVTLPITAGSSVNVELGGCWRTARGNKTGTGDAAVIGKLLGLR